MTSRLKPCRVIAVFLLCLTAPAAARAQQNPNTATAAHQHDHQSDPQAVELFPTRDASGTAWLPDDTPMFGAHRAWRGWEVMLHGVGFVEFLYEPGDRHRTGGFSTHQLGSVNWGMMMARRRVGNARVGLRAMASLEPWTVPGCGYISFLATGEMCEGDTIHDRQHPHDLFMELGADYDRRLHGSWRWQVYAGFAGEPALGPVGFPHRLSALPNPIAPISHHWLDSSHITFGLITAGLHNRRWKMEMSVFNAREPDENRGDLDLAALDSFAGRVTFLPTDRVALQVSAGHLDEAELEFAPLPRSDVDKATASATYHQLIGRDGIWASTLAYGVNSAREFTSGGPFDAVTQAVLAESSVTVRERHTWFGRAEVVEKPAHDLHAHEFTTAVFTIGKLQAGYLRTFTPWRGLVAGAGGAASLSIVPPALAPRYGGRAAPGFGVFLTLRPSRHVMSP